MKLQEEKNSYPYLRVTDMKDETILDFKIQYAPKQVRDSIKNYTISSKDLYITIAGTIGNAGTIPEKYDGALLTENALKLILHPLVNKLYLVKAINSSAVQNQFQVLFNQVAQPKLSIRSTNSTLIPLPPINEQDKIINKLSEMLGLVNTYSESYQSLKQINEEFPEKLRKSILQYAMQGKLVPQDPNDEPVEVLLDKIRAEKQKLFEEGKLKKKDLLESIIYKGDDNSYYEKIGSMENRIDIVLPKIPKTWNWSHLNSSIFSNIGLTFKPTDVAQTGVPVLKANNIRNGQINYDKVTYVSQNTRVKDSEWLSKGDVLMAVRSGSKSLVGKSAVIHDIEVPTSFGAFMSVIRPLIIKSEYLTTFFESPFFRNQLEEANTTTIYQVTQKMLKEVYFPIAPVQEQERIINQVFQLNQKLSELLEQCGFVHHAR